MWDTRVIPHTLPFSRKVKVSGAVRESRSRRDDNFIPTAEILVHAELKVGFAVLRHLYSPYTGTSLENNQKVLCLEKWSRTCLVGRGRTLIGKDSGY